MTTTTPDLSLATRAASAAADVLPSVRPLGVGEAQPGEAQAYAAFPGAVVARVVGAAEGQVGVLVGPDLVAALAVGPGGPLSLASAVQPSLDAAARALGARADAGTAVDASALAGLLGTHSVVPLLDGAPAAAVLLSDSLLSAPAAAPTPAAFTPDFGQVTPVPTTAERPRRGIELLNGVDMELTVELGRTRMAVRELLALAPGDVVELDRAAGSPADLLVNGRLIARGEVVVVDEDFGLRITEILESSAS